MTDVSRILVVDLTTASFYSDELITEGTLGMGGKVLGIRLLEKYLDPTVDPLSPENVIAITSSLVSAYGVYGSNRFGAFTKSPLTGIWLECYCGGTFARIMTETRWDAIVVKGAAETPVRLHITGEGAEILPAADLWGKDTLITEDEVLARLEKRSAVLSIGVAGENLVKVASIMHERAHCLGRGGIGAVLGSKRVKAISVTSSGPLKSEPQQQFAECRRKVVDDAKDSPATRNYHLYGTPVMVGLVNAAGAFPTDFFEGGEAPHRATLEVERWTEWCRIESDSCPPCQLRCRKRLIVTEGPDAGREIHAAEYETLYAFGGSCMVERAFDVARLNERCNLLGMDTMSAGNLAAIAIKAREAGHLTEGPAAGEPDSILQLLDEIASRSTPTGDALAKGMDDALAAFDMSDRSITSKRMDPAGYEPRRLKGMALSYALSPRGACHLRATFYKPELTGLLKGLDDDAYVETYIDWENRMLLMDSLTMCRFYRDLLTWDFFVSAATQLNGEPVTKDDLRKLCDQTLTRIRRLNLAFGVTPAADTVAERFFKEPTDKAPALDRAELERRVRLYWIKRGWSEKGYPPPLEPAAVGAREAAGL
jgi:aldehyde:ferredoxin oxidoreductase